MKKQSFFVILLLLAVLSLYSAESKKPRLYFKFKGIGSIANGGDFKDFIDRSDAYFTDLKEGSSLYTISLTETPFYQGFGGEIGIAVKNYSVGISCEFIKKSFQIDYNYAADDSDYVENYTREHTFSAIPIFLFIHYKIINTRLLSAYFTIGEGVYLSKYKDERTITYENYSNEKGQVVTFANSTIESKKNRLGFHIGTTIDVNINSNMAISLEAGYRLASFKEMTAKSYYKDDNEEEEAEDTFYYWTNVRNGQGQLTLGAPTNKIFWEGEPAKLNLNGFSFSVGIKITLGTGAKKKTEKVAAPDVY